MIAFPLRLPVREMTSTLCSFYQSSFKQQSPRKTKRVDIFICLENYFNAQKYIFFSFQVTVSIFFTHRLVSAFTVCYCWVANASHMVTVCFIRYICWIAY